MLRDIVLFEVFLLETKQSILHYTFSSNKRVNHHIWTNILLILELSMYVSYFYCVAIFRKNGGRPVPSSGTV